MLKKNPHSCRCFILDLLEDKGAYTEYEEDRRRKDEVKIMFRRKTPGSLATNSDGKCLEVLSEALAFLPLSQLKNIPASRGFTTTNVRTLPQPARHRSPLCYSGLFEWSFTLIAETLRLPWNIMRLSHHLMPYFIIIVSNHTRAVSLWRWCFIIHSVKTWTWLFLVKQTSSNGFYVITPSVFISWDYRASFSFQSEMDETINKALTKWLRIKLFSDKDATLPRYRWVKSTKGSAREKMMWSLFVQKKRKTKEWSQRCLGFYWFEKDKWIKKYKSQDLECSFINVLWKVLFCYVGAGDSQIENLWLVCVFNCFFCCFVLFCCSLTKPAHFIIEYCLLNVIRRKFGLGLLAAINPTFDLYSFI